eukprot:gene7944-biopygen13559
MGTHQLGSPRGWGRPSWGVPEDGDTPAGGSPEDGAAPAGESPRMGTPQGSPRGRGRPAGIPRGWGRPSGIPSRLGIHPGNSPGSPAALPREGGGGRVEQRGHPVLLPLRAVGEGGGQGVQVVEHEV